ncbi:MAG TPA: DUF5916 domain-containing protein [Thermoanaerobaculia bacterium]|jgi:hypothetical protein|nr:DUF5916 domain-containing protein [Thermoanaerobaculia bacterium]
MIPRLRSFMAAFLYFAVSIPAGAAPSVAAKPVSERIVLDGVLNDDAWKGVPAASGFTQREPRAGEPATEETEVRVAYTPSTLYIAIRALDSEPRAVVARAMQRDSDVAEDDSVSIVLDTFDDRKNGYFFATNANGARTDALMSDDGDDFNVEWNGVWNVKARRTEEGWTAEMEIPFSTLRFSPGKEAWGMNVRRLVRRKSEESYWAPLPLEADLTRVSLAGRLTGLEGMSPGLNLRVKPFTVASGYESLARQAKDREDGVQADNDNGVDVKWGIGRGLSLDLTVSTDFAESEADEQQVNLSRFSLFLPERREFFLENAGLFEFGPRALFGAPVLRPFFSRRVGLTEDGEAVPIEWGTRLTGRTGLWSVGLLDAQTGAPGGDGGGDNWGVLRLKRRVGEQLSVGLLSTRHATDGHENRVYGMDADWNPTPRLKVRSFWAQSDDTADGTGRTGGLGAIYRGPVWRWSLDAAEIGERFDPEAGFLLRRGVRRYAGSLTYVPRPEIPHIRNLFFEGRSEAYTDLDGRLDWMWNGFDLFSFRTKSDDVVSFYADARYERLDEPFEIHSGVFIPAAEHRFGDLGLWGETNASRAVSASAWVQKGSFYDGTRLAHGMSLRLRPGRHFRSESSWDEHHVELPGGTFDTNLFRQRLTLALTPDLSAAAFAQWSDTAELLAMNVRLNWIYRPGADVFLVFNETWDAPGLGRRTERDRQAILKLTWLFAA